MLNASANRWRLWLQKRHRLALHVGASQAAVNTVLLDKWHEARGRPKDLLVRSVHESDFAGIYLPWLEELARTNAIAHKGAILIKASTSVGNHLSYFLRSIEVDDFISHAAINYLEVWCLNKAVFVDTCVGGEVKHQANVGTLWCLHRANPAIVGGVSIAHFKAGSLPTQTTRPHRAQATLVAQLRQWVYLIKQLAQLATGEELAHCCHYRASINQLAWRNCLEVTHAHTIHCIALHPEHTNAELARHQLANQFHAAIAQRVDIISWLLGVVKANNFTQDTNQITHLQCAIFGRIGHINT